jgi:predicted enzyme related to lactoylglutathione lyase
MRLVHILDCVDPQPLAEFWSQALGFRVGSWEPPYQRIVDPSGRWPDLIFQAVPEAKRGKNRMHLDIQLTDMRKELQRLLELGAQLVEAPHDDGGYEIATLADPQGNEFCLVVPPPGSYDHDHLLAVETQFA